MKFNFLILLAILSIVILSCDDGIKFDNPNDEKNKAAVQQGELGGECYPNKTCDEGLTCDKESNTCIEEPKDTNDDDGTDTMSSNDEDEPISDDSDSTHDDADSIEDSDANDTIPDEDNDNADTEADPDETDIGEVIGETRLTKCNGLPENAIWNSVSEIAQRWDGEKWIPTSVASFNLEESNSECRFKCESKYIWDGSSCVMEEIIYNCDSEIDPNSTDAMDYAKAIGICETTTADSSKWGLISAKITAPNGSTQLHANSHGLVSKFGNVVTPKSGTYMLALTSGKIKNNKFESYTPLSGISTGAPADWLEKNGNKFPSADACNGNSGTSGSVNDAVMLDLEIKAPQTAKSFSFNIYFFTKEYYTYVCTQFNDFFIALLNSGYTSDDPNLKNPADMNLAMDANGNPVGVNLAPAGLFTQCKNYSGTNYNGKTITITSCNDTEEELQGTGFETHGGTGWLTTRGNVVPGETIRLRLAIWDLSDSSLDSLVLIDNFKWDATAQKPGTGIN